MSKPLNKKTWIGGGVLLILVIAAVIYFWPKSTGLTYNYTPAQIGDIKSEVSASGLVQAATDVQLAFERSGKVTQSLVKVGDTVKAGQVLATLDSADLAAQLAQAQAAVLSAEAQWENAKAGYQAQIAKLQDMKNGASAADLNLSQAQVDSAAQTVTDSQSNYDNAQAQTKIALNNQYSHSVDLINSAYSSAFDAINSKLAGIFSDPQAAAPDLTFNTTDNQGEINAKANIIASEASLNSWNSSLATLDPANYQATDQALTDSLARLNTLADFLRQINTLLSHSISSTTLTPAVLSAYKTNLNLGLANINAAILALNGQKQAIAGQIATNNSTLSQALSQLNLAKNSLTVAQKAWSLKKSGATAEQIAAQTAAVAQAEAGISAQAAAVAQAEASVQNFSAQLAKSSLVSPLDGLVSQNDAKVGEAISLNAPIISVISQAKYQIAVQIPESSIANVKLGQTAQVTLDAYGPSQTFVARVIAIDPASTLVNGLAGYKVTLEFLQNYPEVKTGLSANVQILTAENTNALVVPSSAIIKRGDISYVIIDNGTAAGSEREVNTGLSSLDGRTEITSGLQSGERVASFGSVSR